MLADERRGPRIVGRRVRGRQEEDATAHRFVRPARSCNGRAMSSARRSFIPMAAPVLGEAERSNVLRAVDSGWISSQGEFVTELETRFAAYAGAAHGVAVSNGTTALHLALAVLGVKPGDEVILPPITHIACINAVTYQGATPVLADCDPRSWCIDP